MVTWEDLQGGKVAADVLANTTSVGMVPNVEDTPVPTEAVKNVSDLWVFATVCSVCGYSMTPCVCQPRVPASQPARAPCPPPPLSLASPWTPPLPAPCFLLSGLTFRPPPHTPVTVCFCNPLPCSSLLPPTPNHTSSWCLMPCTLPLDSLPPTTLPPFHTALLPLPPPTHKNHPHAVQAGV